MKLPTVFYHSINNEYYKIVIYHDNKEGNALEIWKYSAASINQSGFWIYTASAKIKHGKLGYNWDRFIPQELAKFCERTLANKAFW